MNSICSDVEAVPTKIPEGKHVLLSFSWSSHDLVSKVYQILKKQGIPVWFDANGDRKENMYERYMNNSFYFLFIV